jgi:hypothetical protein
VDDTSVWVCVNDVLTLCANSSLSLAFLFETLGLPGGSLLAVEDWEHLCEAGRHFVKLFGWGGRRGYCEECL